jgi:hypothetical protein
MMLDWCGYRVRLDQAWLDVDTKEKNLFMDEDQQSCAVNQHTVIDSKQTTCDKTINIPTHNG